MPTAFQVARNHRNREGNFAMVNRYQQNPGIIAAELDNEVVMLSISSGKYFALRGSGQVIWEAMSNPISLGEIVAIVQQSYQVDEAQCCMDSERFLEELAQNELIKIV